MKLLALLLTPLGFLLRRKRANPARSIRHAPELQTSTSLEVTSEAFSPGGVIPLRHATMDLGPNISPALAWSEPPAGTEHMLLVMEDIDVPMTEPGRHMIAFFAPEPTGIAEGELTPDSPRFTYLPVRGGRTGYQGPRPLPGHGLHRYTFHLYALDTTPAVTTSTGLADVLPHLAGHVLASGHLEGVLRG